MLRDSTLLAASPSGLSRGSRNAMVKGRSRLWILGTSPRMTHGVYTPLKSREAR